MSATPTSASTATRPSVFVNYDGTSKRRTTVGSHVRFGSDTMFVAPVTIGDGAYTGAGTVGGRCPAGGAKVLAGQRNIENWVQRKRPGSPALSLKEPQKWPRQQPTTT